MEYKKRVEALSSREGSERLNHNPSKNNGFKCKRHNKPRITIKY
jgi:hypothetical protein